MDTESLGLLIEGLRKANATLQAQVDALTAQLQAKEEGEPEPMPQPDETAKAETPSAAAALEMVERRNEAARAKNRAYIDAMRKRGMSCGTDEDYHEYMAATRRG